MRSLPGKLSARTNLCLLRPPSKILNLSFFNNLSTESSTSSIYSSTVSSTPTTPSLDFPGVSASPKGVSSSSQPPQLMLAVYTCKVCETRSARRISKSAYEKGSVLLCCPGCKKLHVLSDHLGYFDDATVDAAKILEERGETVRRLSNSDALLELLTEDDLKVFRSVTKGVSLKDGTEKAVVNMGDRLE